MQIESSIFVDEMRRPRCFRQVFVRIGYIGIGIGTVQRTGRSRGTFVRSKIVHLNVTGLKEPD